MADNDKNLKDIEKKSSAITLSDMEIFVFPELLYSLLLANIMSPILWKWKEDPWFEGIEKKSAAGKIKRLQQYVMDNYLFNLDLNTWGLTDKNIELERFKNFIAPSDIEKTNALFGYEGDKYYFDIDIRRHFGLDGYNDDIIPYWKTETIEAMDAFKYRPGFNSGAGECVSLSLLYAAALFVVLGIPLEKIFLIATPLHSQNFIDAGGGFLSNNRRVINKNNWFNGTPISMKARRALENEKITIVASNTGYIHTYYSEATIDEKVYGDFRRKLDGFLKTPLNKRSLGSFLRGEEKVHECIQYRHTLNGRDAYIELEKIFRYEENMPYFFTHETREHLLGNIDSEDFHLSPLPDRIILNDMEEYISDRDIDLSDEEEMEGLRGIFAQDCMNAYKLLKKLTDFCITKPGYPEAKNFTGSNNGRIEIGPGMGRKEIIKKLEMMSADNQVARLAFYAYRDMRFTEKDVYLKTALERNPVSAQALGGLKIPELINKLNKFGSNSIYSGAHRLAQPDEVFNFSTADGLEKAVTAANVILNAGSANEIYMDINGDSVKLHIDGDSYNFKTRKKIRENRWILHPYKII